MKGPGKIMNAISHIIAFSIIGLLLLQSSVYPYEAKKNDIMSYLRSKGHRDVTVDKYGDIAVGIAGGTIDFKVEIILKKSDGKTWAIKTAHTVPVKITRDKVDFMVRLANIHNRRKGILRTAYVKKKENSDKLIIKSWFPCGNYGDKNTMLEEYHANSFKMVTSQLNKLYHASKCVVNNSSEKSIKACLEEFELSKGF